MYLNFQNVGHLNYHKKNVHVDKDKKNFKCKECDYETYAQRYLTTHIRKFHLGLEYKHECEHCGECFLYPYELKAHTVIFPSESFV